MMIQNLPDALLFVERTTLIIDRHAHAVDEASNDATGRKGVVAQLGCIEQPDGNGFRQGGGISQRIGDARRRKLRNRIEEQMRLFDQLRCPRSHRRIRRHIGLTAQRIFDSAARHVAASITSSAVAAWWASV
jgi:hypothetical protein